MLKMRTLSILLLVICCYTDIKTRGISVKILVAFFAASILLITGVYFFKDRIGGLEGLLIYKPCLRNTVCALLPGGLLFLLSFITHEGIGRGDVYVVMLLGLMIGFDRVFAVLFISMISCGIFGLSQMMIKGKGRKETLPYIPFLLGAYAVCVLIKNMGGMG